MTDLTSFADANGNLTVRITIMRPGAPVDEQVNPDDQLMIATQVVLAPGDGIQWTYKVGAD